MCEIMPRYRKQIGLDLTELRMLTFTMIYLKNAGTKYMPECTIEIGYYRLCYASILLVFSSLFKYFRHLMINTFFKQIRVVCELKNYILNSFCYIIYFY